MQIRSSLGAKATLDKTTTLYTYVSDADFNATSATGSIRGPGNYTTESAWADWRPIISESFTPTASYSKSVTYTPTAAGTYNYHGSAGDQKGLSATGNKKHGPDGTPPPTEMLPWER